MGDSNAEKFAAELKEAELRHHELTGTTSVKKLDLTPPLRPGKLEDPEELEDHIHLYGAGGSRPGIGLPNYSPHVPEEVSRKGVVKQ